MPIKSEYIENLVNKFHTGKISLEELQILTKWYNSHDDQYAVISSKKDESHDQVKARMLQGLLAKVASEQKVTQISLYSGIKWIVAAAAVFLIALGIWTVQDDKKPLPEIATVKSSIEPGGNKATITLADGRTIVLSDSQTGIVAGKAITYINGAPVDNTALNPSEEVQQLTFHTPRGGTYSITLEDGSQVWLNAESTMKYPSRFSVEERVIEIEGEAYFKVKPLYAEDGKRIPFRVISKKQTIEVLGTAFNMNTYSDQASSKTTLVEGKIALNDGKNHILLAPNEQAVTTTGKTRVSRVNTANYTAWRDGKFAFDGKTFEETMNEIGRWYDLDIVYENGVPNEELAGDAYRNQNIGFVLRLLDVAEINYKLDVGLRKITIKGKNNKM